MHRLLPRACAFLFTGALAAAGPVPRDLTELWAGFDPREDPLESELLKEWEQDGAVCRIVRYQVGVFKGAPSKVAAFYAVPKDGTKLPAILDIHGGGQSASLQRVVTFARSGYAAMSINWGGNAMALAGGTWDGPRTDWGRLDATHPPQRDPVNHFAGSLTPNDYTLDPVESPRNSNWFVVLMAARRAITFLETRPEVDPERIGVAGHSMGGKLATNLAGIDRRIKAAVPSCGGAGDLLESDVGVPGGSRSNPSPLVLACVSDNAYLPRITCPVLWLSPTNDFHAHIDNMAWNWRDLPDDRTRFSISPHLNHRHTGEHAITELLWFEEHLKGAGFKMPRTPGMTLELATAAGVPRVTVTPDETAAVRRVDIYYSVDPHGLTRFWRDAGAVKSGGRWQAECPLMTVGQPVFAFANVIYDTPGAYRGGPLPAGQENSDSFAIRSRVLSAGPARLRAAGVRATDRPTRMIDDGARGWHDWYRLNWGHPPLWTATTRKLKDAKWRGPDGATLCFEVRCEADNQLVLTFQWNAWGAFAPGKPAAEYTVVKPLKGSPGWQRVSVAPGEPAAAGPDGPASLTDWRSVTEFSISPGGSIAKDGKKVEVDARPWQGPREIRNLRWEGGEYPRPSGQDSAPGPEEFERKLDDPIKKAPPERHDEC